MNTTSSIDWIARAWSTSIGQISHALATKMATLQFKQQGLQKIIPSLLKGYHIAVEQHLMEDEISAKTMKHLEDMQNLDEQITPMFKLLEQLNNYSNMIAHHDESKSHCLSVKQYLDDFIENYAFEQSSQKNLITLNQGQDFAVDYPALFIDTSLRHLLTAALQRVMKSGKGDIQLWVSDEDDYHVFNIKDTSQSLTADQLTNLFSQFLFESYDKSRPGLGFCKLAMLHMGGDITCKTVNDKCTHFQIKLPKTDN